jgi:hypothetical protein
MTTEEIEIIRLALDTEVEHKDYAKHNLDAKTILNYHEVLNKRQTLPIHIVSHSDCDGKCIINNTTNMCMRCGLEYKDGLCD